MHTDDVCTTKKMWRFVVWKSPQRNPDDDLSVIADNVVNTEDSEAQGNVTY